MTEGAREGAAVEGRDDATEPIDVDERTLAERPPAQPSPAASRPAPSPVSAAHAAAGAPTPIVGVAAPFPRRLLYAIVGVVLVLLVLTAVINKVASSSSGPGTSTPTTAPHHLVGGTAPPSASSQLHAPLRDLLDLTALHDQRATPFSLTAAATGQTVSLSSLRGRVVVLTFADANCKDICPVLAAELHAAAADLPKTAVPVSFVTVNSDPLATQARKASILEQPLLASVPGWTFLTGSVHQLDPVWKDYGISITADPSNGVVSHNDLMYFITPDGSLAWSAIPFADQSATGSFSLARPVIARFGAGIAYYASELAR